jgi:hypothetical protein
MVRFMIDKININPMVFKNYSSNLNGESNPIDNKSKNFNFDFYVDKDGAEAIKIRNFVNNPLDISCPISLNDYKRQLINAGLVEDKDFSVINNSNGGTIYIRKGEELPRKIVHWHNGNGGTDADNYSGYENCIYPKNQGDLTQIAYSYDKNGVLEKVTHYYSNPDIHSDLLPSNININTTPEEYINSLDKQNIQYEVDKETIGKTDFVFVYEKSGEGNVSNATTFTNSNDGIKTIDCYYCSNKNVDLTHGVSIYKDDDFYQMKVIDYK